MIGTQQFTAEVCNANSKDMEHSNNGQRELSQEFSNSSSPKVFEHSSASSTTALLTSTNAQTNFIKSALNDASSTSSANELHDATNNSGEILFNSSAATGVDAKSFDPMLYKEEYKNGSLFVIPGKGRVIVPPRTPCEPIFPNFVMPPLSPPTYKSKGFIKNLYPKKESTDSEELSLKLSLSALLHMPVEWVQVNMEKIFNFEQPNFEDFANHLKIGLKRLLDFLKQINDRINILLKAANGLPDPKTLVPNVSGCGMISIRVGVVNSGIKAKCRLKAIETETNETLDMFVSLYPNDAKVNNEYFTTQLETKAKIVLINAFVKFLDDFESLREDIENFRAKIREFYLEIEKLL